MLKKTMTFKDLDGNDVTEDFYFNLTTAEIAEMELGKEGGFGVYLQTLIESNDGGKIIAAFKDILKASVGKRSEDGRRFIKNQDIIDEFMQSNAYSDLFMELATNTDLASEFIKSIVPAEAKDAVEKGQPVTDLKLPEGQTQSDLPAWVNEGRVPTDVEIRDCPPHLIQEAFRRKTALPPSA